MKQVHWLIVHKFVLYILCIFDVKLAKKFVTIEKSPLIFLIYIITAEPNEAKICGIMPRRHHDKVKLE